MKRKYRELLEKAVTNKITDDEEDELRVHLWHCESTNMEFVQYACEKNYILAYDLLANIYSQGKLCPQD